MDPIIKSKGMIWHHETTSAQTFKESSSWHT
jgi:hypothetical protein